MGMSKKLNVIPFYTILVVFAMCVPSVEDPVSKNTCDWNCSAQSGDIDSKELEGKISHGDLVKLEITGKKRVDPSCGSANDTLDLNNKTEDAELWFKMAPTSMGKIAFLSSTILEEIFTGRIFFKSSKAINVSCIFKPKTKSTINHSSIFAFHVARSVMYFVKEMANYSKRDVYFLTLIRMEKQTHITFDKSSLETSSQVDAPYDEWKLTVDDTWKVAGVLIAICIALCAPVTLLLFRPSKVIVQLTHETRENSKGARSPVHDDYVNDEPLNSPIQEELQDGDVEETDVSSYGITETLDNERSSLMGTESEMVGAPQRTPFFNRKTYSKRANVVFRKTFPMIPSTSVESPTDGEETRIPKSRCNGPQVSPDETARALLVSLTDSEQTQTFETSDRYSGRPESFDETAASSAPCASVESLNDDEQMQTFENSHLTQDASAFECHTGEIAGSGDGRVENDSSGTFDTVVDIRQTPDHRSSRMEGQIVSHEGNRNCISMIIVGRPSPVSIGSWIGNNFFLSSNGNQCHKLKMLVKVIFIPFFPLLLLTGFGDLLLILLNIDQEIAPDLPNQYLTSSVFNEVFNAHLGLTILAVFSLVCYTIRSLFAYGVTSEFSIIIWKSCFVHSRHPLVFSRLRCLFWPCNECKHSPSEYVKYFEVPDNISHNLKELPRIFIKYWSFLFQCFVEYVVLLKNNLLVNIILILLVISITVILAHFWPYLLLVLSLIFILLFTPLVDILLSSPLLCLCHWRMRVLRFKYLEFLLTFFSLIWLVVYSVSGAVVVESAITGFLKMLSDDPKKLLLNVIVVALGCHYILCSYSCLTAQYLELVKELFNSYSKKFKELEEKGEGNKLVNFKQGKHKKLIPTKLFKYAREHDLIEMPVIDSVAIMLLKILPLLPLFFFVYPLIHLPRPDYVSIGTTVVSLLTVYNYLNNLINKETKFNEGHIDIVVNEYIKKQQ